MAGGDTDSGPGQGLFGHAGTIIDGKIVVFDGTQTSGGFTISDQVLVGQIDADATGDSATFLANRNSASRFADVSCRGVARRRCWSCLLLVGSTDSPYSYDGSGYNGRPEVPLDQVMTAMSRRNRRRRSTLRASHSRPWIIADWLPSPAARPPSAGCCNPESPRTKSLGTTRPTGAGLSSAQAGDAGAGRRGMAVLLLSGRWTSRSGRVPTQTRFRRAVSRQSDGNRECGRRARPAANHQPGLKLNRSGASPVEVPYRA